MGIDIVNSKKIDSKSVCIVKFHFYNVNNEVYKDKGYMSEDLQFLVEK